MSDSGHGGFDRWQEVCKPAFDRVRDEFQEIDDRFNRIDGRFDQMGAQIEVMREEFVRVREKLNNGINDKLENAEKMMNLLQKKLDRMLAWILGAAGTVILGAISLVVMAAAGVLGGG